jgi:hypothetical protein
MKTRSSTPDLTPLPSIPSSSFLEDVLQAAEESAMMDFSEERHQREADPIFEEKCCSSVDSGFGDHSSVQLEVESICRPVAKHPLLLMADDDSTASFHDGENLDDDHDGDDIETTSGSDSSDYSGPSEDYDYLHQFRPVMECLNLGSLAQTALLVRLSLDPDLTLNVKKLPNLTCKVMEDPRSGEFNLAYTIYFSDGVLWIARIPGHGTPDRFGPGSLDAEKMACEYQTMEYIREHTTIPIPKLYFWDTSCERVGVPFALMEYIPGKSLEDAWHESFTEQQRLNTLSDIATYMAQLQSLSFDRIGMLRFEEAGAVKEVGQWLLPSEENGVPWASTVPAMADDNLTQSLTWDVNDLEEEIDEDDIEARPGASILKLAIESVPAFLTSEASFALTPMELNYQNIIVDSDGKITAFIDWDLVHTDAATCGYARYPIWLNKDWNSAYYAYANGKTGEEDVRAHPPAMLTAYRQHYFQEMAKLASADPSYDSRMTEVSHILEAISIAISRAYHRRYIIEKLFDHAFQGKPPFSFSDYIEDYALGDIEEKKKLIQQSFATMWHAEWDMPTTVTKISLPELSDDESVISVISDEDSSDESSAPSSGSDQ